MPWVDIALAAIWTATLIAACRHWARTYRRDDHTEHQRRQLLKELHRHLDHESETQ